MLKSVSNAGARRGIAQSGSASGLGPEGRRFESCCPDQLKTPGTKLRHPPGQLRGYTPPGSGPARSRSCRLNSHSKLSGSFSITPTASPRASRAFQIDNGVESIASDDQPVVPGDGTSGRRKANPGMAPNVTASSVRQTQSIEATILMSNQASYVALQPAICDGSEGGEREGTQQVQSRRIRGAG